MKALCVIDVQKDFTTTPLRFPIPKDQLDAMIERINHLIEAAEKSGTTVIYVRQVNQSWGARLFSRVFTQGLVLAGNPGCEIDPRLKMASTNVFDKERPSSFSGAEFSEFIQSRGIQQLTLAGMDGCLCIHSTAKDAMKRGLTVELMEDAIVSSFPGRWAKLKKRLHSRGARVTRSRHS